MPIILNPVHLQNLPCRDPGSWIVGDSLWKFFLRWRVGRGCSLEHCPCSSGSMSPSLHPLLLISQPALFFLFVCNKVPWIKRSKTAGSVKQLLWRRQVGEEPTEHVCPNLRMFWQVWDHVPQHGSPEPVSRLLDAATDLSLRHFDSLVKWEGYRQHPQVRWNLQQNLLGETNFAKSNHSCH